MITLEIGHDEEGYFPFAEYVDKSVPYVRALRGTLNRKNAGRWADLKPDAVVELRKPKAGVPGRVEYQQLHDGRVRARLLDLDVSKERWEAAEPETRKRIKAACYALGHFEAAVRAAVGANGSRERVAAVGLLKRMTKMASDDFDAKRGWWSQSRSRASREEVDLIVEPLTTLLRVAKRQARRRVALYKNSDWLAEHVAAANKVLTEFPFGVGAVCIAADIGRLEFEAPGDVALDIYFKGETPWTRSALRAAKARRPKSARPKP